MRREVIDFVDKIGLELDNSMKKEKRRLKIAFTKINSDSFRVIETYRTERNEYNFNRREFEEYIDNNSHVFNIERKTDDVWTKNRLV